MRNRRLVLVLLVFLVLIFLAQPLMASTKRIAKIIEISGTVTYQKGGGERELKAFKGMSLAQGDRLLTGKDGKAVLEIDDDKKLNVGSNSVLDLSQLSGIKGENEQTRLNMWKGEVLTEIGDRLNTQSRFEIKTPTAVMGVRGTWFVVGQQSNGTYIAVIEGALYALSNVPAEQGEQFAAFLEENEQLTLDELASFAEGVQAEPLSLDELPLVALEDLQENIDKLPEGLKEQVEQNIGQVIEQKQQQQQQQQQQIEQQIQQLLGGQQGIIPFLPPTPPAPPTGGGGGGDVPPVPQVSNDLSGLELTLIPSSETTINNFTFNPATYIYQGITTTGSPTRLTITPTASAGVITVNGSSVVSGSQSGSIPLVGDSALVVITVTESGKTPKTYTLYIGDHLTNTKVTTKQNYYDVTVSNISLIPADNPIEAESAPLTIETTVGTFLNNLNPPPGSTWKVFANADNPLGGDPPGDPLQGFANNPSKNNSDFLAADDLLFVLGGDGLTLRGYRIILTEIPAGTLGGKITMEGTEIPVAGVSVMLKNRWGGFAGWVFTDDNGNFNFSNVRSGSYRLFLYKWGYFFRFTDVFAYYSESPTSNHIATIRSKSQRVVSGFILDGNDESGLPGVAVDVFKLDGTLVAENTTDADGSYIFVNLPEGDYYFRMNKSGYYSAVEELTIHADNITVETILLNELSNNASLQVVVMDEGEQSQEDVFVSIYQGGELLSDFGYTDGQGGINFDVNQGSSYHIEAWKKGYNKKLETISGDLITATPDPVYIMLNRQGVSPSSHNLTLDEETHSLTLTSLLSKEFENPDLLADFTADDGTTFFMELRSVDDQVSIEVSRAAGEPIVIFDPALIPEENGWYLLYIWKDDGNMWVIPVAFGDASGPPPFTN